jgi:hypothetical protein
VADEGDSQRDTRNRVNNVFEQVVCEALQVGAVLPEVFSLLQLSMSTAAKGKHDVSRSNRG